MTADLRPGMGVYKDTRFFSDGLQAGKLLIQRCEKCDRLQHPPGPCCKYCQSFEWDTMQACGRGKLASFIKVHHPALPGFDKSDPVGLIELEEGTRTVAQLIYFKADEIIKGTAVKLVITSCDDQLTLPLFAPALLSENISSKQSAPKERVL